MAKGIVSRTLERPAKKKVPIKVGNRVWRERNVQELLQRRRVSSCLWWVGQDIMSSSCSNPSLCFQLGGKKKKKGYQYAGRRLPVEIHVELASLGICGTPLTNTSQPWPRCKALELDLVGPSKLWVCTGTPRLSHKSAQSVISRRRHQNSDKVY